MKAKAEEADSYRATYKNLREKITAEPFVIMHRSPGYAHYDFHGQYSPTLTAALGRTPTPDELIMLVDGGVSHFGAHCNVDHESQRFSGYVNTD